MISVLPDTKLWFYFRYVSDSEQRHAQLKFAIHTCQFNFIVRTIQLLGQSSS